MDEKSMNWAEENVNRRIKERNLKNGILLEYMRILKECSVLKSEYKKLQNLISDMRI